MLRANGGARGWLACALLLVLTGVGCHSTERTALVVEVRTMGLQAAVDLDQVVARVNSKDRMTFHLVPVADGTLVAFPFRFTVVPNKSSDEKVTVEVVGRLKGDDKVRASGHLGFVKNQVRVLTLTLEESCVAKSCKPEETCRGGDCAPNEVDVNKLPVFMGPPDGGGDAGRDGDGPARDRPEVLPDGAVCLDGDIRDCSCGAMAGGSQPCDGGKWGECTISCAASGLMGPCAAGVRICDESKSQWGLCSIAAAAADTCAPDNDDNCNGIKNEGCPCTMGQSRTCDKGGLFGKCAAGMQTCDGGGKWSACSIMPSAADTCAAGNDDNCNGNINEGCPCVQGTMRACSAGGLFGKCAAGMQTCNQSTWSACSIAPSAVDSCVPGNDDNCNGTKNDGCACVMGQTRTCAQGGLFGKCAGGMQTCDGDGKWGACSIAPSANDTCVSGNDDNCNGRNNDGCLCVTTQTRLCSEAGIKGKCANGSQGCDATGRWGACSITPAAADTCAPGDDSTCNGVANEGCGCVNNTMQLCSMGGYKGKCGNGMQTCANGAWGACSITPSPRDTCELGNDDNCNGNVNEGCPCINGRTRNCSEGGLFGKCANGMQTCNGGAWSACTITPSNGDTCEPNNDDNCNGTKNDGCMCVHGGTPRACSVGGAQGTCAGGTQTCTAAGQWGACSIQPAAKDSCDSVTNDDNCNGTPFEDCQCKNNDTQPCTSSLGCAGTQTCANGRWGTCSNTVNDNWSTQAGTLSHSSSPWRIVWPPATASLFPTASAAQGGQVTLPYDTVVRRVPGLDGGYVVSFNVVVSPDFAFQLSYGGTGPFPAIEKPGPNMPHFLGGLTYGNTESFTSYGSWNHTQSGGASVRLTLYVKADGQELAAWDGFGTSSLSGFVSKPGMDAKQYFQLVGSNSPDYVRHPTNGPEPTVIVGNIKGCAGLTDTQVQTLYDQRKVYAP